MRWSWFAILVCAISAPLPSTFAEENDEGRVELFAESSRLLWWEFASSELLGVGPMEQRRLFDKYQETHSAHEIALLNEFRGPIQAADLQKRFTWTLKESKNDWVLVGVPRDSVDALFFQSVTVVLDAETSLPKTVQFQGEKPLAVALTPRPMEPNRFVAGPVAKPLTPLANGPIRVVEHVTLMPSDEQRIEDRSPTLLQLWETAAKGLVSFQAKIERRVYETSNQIEHRADGEFQYTADPFIRMSLKPSSTTPLQKSERESSAGADYELLPSPGEHWEFRPGQICYFDSASPTEPPVSIHPDSLPKEIAGKTCPPWLMLFSVSARELANHFDIQLGTGPGPAHFVFYPKVARNFGVMKVYFDAESHLPQVVHLSNGRGDIETVYHLSDVKVSRRKIVEPGRLPIPVDAKPIPAATAD